MTLTETATNTAEFNISGTVTGSLVIASMSSTIGVPFSQSSAKTWGWSYVKRSPMV